MGAIEAAFSRRRYPMSQGQSESAMEEFLLPQLVVRAGLTGHRPNRLSVPPALISAQIEAVLNSMEEAARLVANEEPELYRSEPPVLRFTTGLARGTDEIGAEVALRKNWQLQSVIAFDRQTFASLAVSDCTENEAADYRQRYATLLERSSSVLELRGNEQGGFLRDGYELVGEVTLKQTDVLIGVWDGEPARGLGGSTHVMRMALQRGLPVVWIHATRTEEATKVYLPGQSGTHDLAALTQWLFGSLVLGPPTIPSKKNDQEVRQRWREFVAEEGGRTGRFPPFFQYLLVLGGKPWPKWPLHASVSEGVWADNWQQFLRALESVDPIIAKHIADALWKPFRQVDHLAELYGRAYRGTYVLIYLLASLATVAGLSGLLWHAIKPGLVVTELLMIIAMLVLTWIGRRNRWHERWLEYRAVAEQLRRARMGVWAGRSLEPSAPEGDASHAGASWASWYVRACVRQLPLIHTCATPAYVRLAVDTIDQLEIEGQKRFNQTNAKVQEHVHERLEWLETRLLGLLILACFFFLLIYGLNIDAFRTDFGVHSAELQQHWTSVLPDVMTFIGALVPALGAALLGVRSQGDFSAYASHSADTAAQLQAILSSIRNWRESAVSDPDFEVLLDLVDRTTEALASDVFAWRMVYRRKVLTVSA